jgi:hypothetical protein
MPSGKSAHELAIKTTVKDLASKELRQIGETGKKSGQSIAAGFIKAQLSLVALRTAVRSLVGAMKSITVGAADQGDQFAKMSRRLGVSVETLSAFDHVARLGGTDIMTMGNALKLLAKNAYESTSAGGGLATAKRAFDALGVSVTDTGGNMKSVEQIFLDVADAVQNEGDELKRSALAQEAFGRSGLYVIPILEQGSAAIREQIKEAHDFGSAWTRTNSRLAEEFKNAQERVRASIDGVKNAIAVQLLPAITEYANKLAQFIAKHRDEVARAAITIIKGVANFFLDAARTLIRVAGEITDVVTRLRNLLRPPETAGDKAAAFLGGSAGLVAKRVATGETAAGADAAKNWVKGFDDQVESMKADIQKTLDGIMKEPTKLPQVAVDRERPTFLQGIVTGASDAVAKLKDAQGTIVDFGRRIGETLVSGAVQGMTDFFDTIVTGAASAGEAFRKLGIDILRTLEQLALNRLFTQLIGAIPGLGGGTASSVGVVSAAPHAEGGLFTTPHLGIVAEKGPEAILSGRQLGDLIAGGGRGQTTVNIVQTVVAAPGMSPKDVADLAADRLTKRLRSPYHSRGLLDGRLSHGT